MAHWAAALAAGPHINYPLMPSPMAELAWKELTLAQQYADKAAPVERALIEALSHRYANRRRKIARRSTRHTPMRCKQFGSNTPKTRTSARSLPNR